MRTREDRAAFSFASVVELAHHLNEFALAWPSWLRMPRRTQMRHCNNSRVLPKWPLPKLPFWHYALSMKISDTIKAVNVKDLAGASGVPVRTLYRWAEEDRIPGRDAEQKFWFDRIKAAARKLPARSEAA